MKDESELVGLVINNKNSEVKVIIRIVGILLSLLIVACSISPVKEETLTSSFSDVEGVMALENDHWIDFSLPDSKGKSVTLSDVLQQNHVLLMFYRGEWCPYCIDQLGSIERVLPQLANYDVKVVAVSVDPVVALENTRRQFTTDYLFLSDADLSVTKQYGIGNTQDLPHPAVFLINRQTSTDEPELLWYYVSEDYKKRPTGEQLLEKVESLLKK